MDVFFPVTKNNSSRYKAIDISMAQHIFSCVHPFYDISQYCPGILSKNLETTNIHLSKCYSTLLQSQIWLIPKPELVAIICPALPGKHLGFFVESAINAPSRTCNKTEN